MQIIPSNPFPTTEEFARQITKLSAYFSQFQIDIVDGEFTSPATIQIEDIVSALTMNHELRTLNLVFDFHLMVNDYKNHVRKLDQLANLVKIDTVFIHFSVKPDIETLKNDYPYAFGVALSPEDSVEDLVQYYLPAGRQGDSKILPAVQIMSVVPGAQGRPFIPEVLNKIEQLRLSDYRNKVYLDGGINEDSLPIILSKKYIPDVL